MIFAANDVRDFHLKIVDHIHEMKNPRAIRPPDGHVGMRSGIGEIEIDFSADEVVHDDVFARRTKAQSSLVLEDVASVLKFLQVALVKFCALALQIWSKIAAHMRALVPVQAEPFQSIVNCGRRFFDMARSVGVFNAQNEFAAVMPRKEPVEERRSRAADVEIASRRGGETDADVRIHVSANLAMNCSGGLWPPLE
jgi:hypothetical protein